MNHNFNKILFTVNLFSAFVCTKAENKLSQPNILIIQCDQQRYDCLGYTGNKIVSTPNINQLANDGMQFTNAYTAIPTSCPARQCLLSGVWPEKHGGLWNYDITLPPRLFDYPTWTEELSKKGYNMGYVGKWHVHPVKTPLSFGFQDYIYNKDYNQWLAKNNIKVSRVLNNPKNQMMGGYSEATKEQLSVHWFARQALNLIKKYKKTGKPWHLRLDYIEPHLPCFPAKEYYEKYKNIPIPEWGNFKEDFDNKPYIQKQQVYNWELEDYKWDEWEKYMRSYYATISQIDDAIGMVLRELQQNGDLDNTIVIYTADHGDAAGSHRMLDKHYVMYEEEVHVPLIIRWDNIVEKGTSCDRFVIHNIDIATTICELLNIGLETDGLSLLPLLKKQEVNNWRKYAFSNYNGQQFGLFVQRMIKDNRYKYVWNPTDKDEFYDLQSDPFELVNNIDNKKYAKEIARLRKDLYEDLLRRKDPVAGKPSAARKQLLLNKKL